MPKPDYTAAAQALLRDANHAVLSTLSVQLPGYPFGSVIPCAVTPAQEPILCISNLAEHAKNIQHDPRVALTAIAPNSAPETQAGARFTYLGTAQPVTDTQLDAVRSQFLALVPSAHRYVGFGDFHFYTIAMTRGRYIGGFGAIAWIAAEAFTQLDPIATAIGGRLEDLNRELATQLDSLGTDIVSVDRFGCNTLTREDISEDKTPQRWSFVEPLAPAELASDNRARLSAVVAAAARVFQSHALI
ncbi:MAG: pyridoxamine 5'-phosphate oxidase family protein [Cyanobacteria bacterium P01_D01_bin.123]